MHERLKLAYRLHRRRVEDRKYALDYINELIDDINRIERGQMDVIDKRNYPERIDYIGDPLIREKLYQLFHQ